MELISTLILKFIGSKALEIFNIPQHISAKKILFLSSNFKVFKKKALTWQYHEQVPFRSIFFSFGATVKIVCHFMVHTDRIMLTWSKEGLWNLFTKLKAMTITCFDSLRGPYMILSTVMQKVGTIIFFDSLEEHRSKMKEQQYNCVGK